MIGEALLIKTAMEKQSQYGMKITGEKQQKEGWWRKQKKQ